MYLAFLQDSRFYEHLFQIDQDLAEQTGRSPCRFCGGKLHSACYERKPRGVPAGIQTGPGFSVCFSFCCSVEGCRRRQRTRSVRFLGPKVYLSVLVTLLTVMRQGPTPRTTRQLTGLFGVDRRTLVRWRGWWQASFPSTRFWQGMRGRFIPSVVEAELPQSLVERFTASGVWARVMDVLRCLSSVFHNS